MEATRRQAQLYTTAAGLFSRHGYHGTTIRQVASELSLQGGSLYAHIDGKEDLLWGIVNQAADQFLGAVRPIATSDAPAVERLREAIRAHVGVVAENLEAATVYFHDWKFLGVERRAQVAARRDEYEALFRQIVADGVARGEFRCVEPKFAAMLVLSAGNWLYQWYRPDGPLGPAEIADELAELILRGLEAAPTGGGEQAEEMV